MTNTKETEAKVLELDEAATPGRWKMCPHSGDIETATGYALLGSGKMRFSESDFVFIAYTRTAAPELARECRRLRERVEELEERLFISERRLKTAHERADKVEPEWHRLGDRVAELEAEVVPMREAFGRCRSMLRLSDVADIGSVVRSVADALDVLYATRSEVTRLEAMLLIAADTNDKLNARVAAKPKEDT